MQMEGPHKVLVIGEPGIGKTSLIRRYVVRASTRTHTHAHTHTHALTHTHTHTHTHTGWNLRQALLRDAGRRLCPQDRAVGRGQGMCACGCETWSRPLSFPQVVVSFCYQASVACASAHVTTSHSHPRTRAPLHRTYSSNCGLSKRTRDLVSLSSAHSCPITQNIRLQLWDIAGQERFSSMTRVYYKQATACVIIFDITRRCASASLCVVLRFASLCLLTVCHCCRTCVSMRGALICFAC
jgi:GTPase SAR1 family protein